MPSTPLRSSGAAQTLRFETDTTHPSPFELSAPCHPACLLFTITSEQDNGGHRARTIANSVSHLRMSSREVHSTKQRFGGARRDRTDDLKLAKLALSQLSYGPIPIRDGRTKLVGLSGLEPLTSRLSGVCSNHLSYRPSEEQTTSSRQFLVTGQLKGIPIGLNLPNILGRKRNEAGARAKGPPDTMSGIIGAA